MFYVVYLTNDLLQTFHSKVCYNIEEVMSHVTYISAFFDYRGYYGVIEKRFPDRSSDSYVITKKNYLNWSSFDFDWRKEGF